MKRATRRSRARNRARGFAPSSIVMESALVIGWFVALILGEKSVSTAADARRSAEDGSEESATAGSAAYCSPQSGSSTGARVDPSVSDTGAPQVAGAIAVATALGVGVERTFPNYTMPMKKIRVTATKAIEGGRQFVGKRGLGCLERPLDTPKGTMDSYRQKLWATNLQGY